MRDYVLALAFIYFTYKAFRVPWVGIMAWTVVSIMNPHKLSWRLDQWPVAAMVAGATLLGILAVRDKREFPVTRETVLLMTLMLWMTVTWLVSPSIEANYDSWSKVMKIDLMLLLALLLLRSKLQIMALVWCLVFSIGYYGVKGGIFTLRGGGSDRVWGPAGSYIEGNNELALALIVTIPLMRLLQMHANRPWIKRGLLGAMILTALAALGSQSRGALLALLAMAAVLWWRSADKVRDGIILLVVGVASIAFMPANWTARMDTIQEYGEDESAMGRINAWHMAWNLASNNFFGGGFDVATVENFTRYAAVVVPRAAHSIYFQILGEHGFVGLFIYLLMWWFVWLSAGHLRKAARDIPEARWLSDLGALSQVSMAGFAVGGSFLSLAYFDLPYNILVLVVLGRAWLARRAWIDEARTKPLPDTRFNRLMADLAGLPRPLSA